MGSRDKFVESIDYADQGLELYSSVISVNDKDMYPKGLMLKFKGCSYRELAEIDKGMKYLKDSYEFLEGLCSKNIDVIASATRMELAKLYITIGNIDKAKEEIRVAIESIRTFDIDSAKIYFGDTISKLEYVSHNLGEANEELSYKLIQKAIDRIPY